MTRRIKQFRGDSSACQQLAFLNRFPSAMERLLSYPTAKSVLLRHPVQSSQIYFVIMKQRPQTAKVKAQRPIDFDGLLAEMGLTDPMPKHKPPRKALLAKPLQPLKRQRGFWLGSLER